MSFKLSPPFSFLLLVPLFYLIAHQNVCEANINSANGTKFLTYEDVVRHHLKHPCRKTPGDLVAFIKFKDSTPCLHFSLNELLYYGFDHSRIGYFHRSPHPGKLHQEDIFARLARIGTEPEDQLTYQGLFITGYNIVLSNRIGVFRGIPDTRHPLCAENDDSVGFDSKDYYFGLDMDRFNFTASIIICYYNEHPTTLMRTLSSILIRSPDDLLLEIIVVDDFSFPDFNITKMSYVLETFTRDLDPKGKIRFFQTPRREGLIRARLFGASHARGEVLVFLDSHIEANFGWLEPLMGAVIVNRTTVAMPMIDVINYETFLYSGSVMVRGGMNWLLHFKWDNIPSELLKTDKDFIKAIRSPTMAGGLFAIERQYFYEMGSYDAGMELWGGENIEMSLRLWMCGGRLVVLPCSRVGHVFRKRRPYGPEVGDPEPLLYNSKRVALVWIDEHIEKFYSAVPEARLQYAGNVDERHRLRRSLNCRNFTWFIDNIYPELKNMTLEDNDVDTTPVTLPRPTKLFQLKTRRTRIPTKKSREKITLL